MNQEKTNFIMGVISGIAVISIVGLVIVSIAYFTKDDSRSPDSKEVAVVEDDKKSPTPTTSKKVDIIVSDNDRIRGNKDAPITIVEFSDIQCPYCSRFHDVMKQVMEKYPDDVRWVYKHFPLDSIHPYARKAAEASECAGDQDKFWEYLDGLFINQKSITTSYFPKLAKELNLNTSEFEECLSDGKYTSKVNSDFSLGQKSGVRATPTSFINGQEARGALSFDQIDSIIQSLK